jgi:transposase
VFGKISGKRYQRISLISGRNSKHKLISPFLFDGMTTTDLVIFWVKKYLLPNLPPNSILIWDNASFHKSNQLKELIQKHGHTMLFLPPYSPDLNPIEHKWQELKHNLRAFYDDSVDFMENLCRQLINLSKLSVG